MIDDEWKKFEARMVNSICLSLASKIKYSVLNEKSSSYLWKKLEKNYMSGFLTNRLIFEETTI